MMRSRHSVMDWSMYLAMCWCFMVDRGRGMVHGGSSVMRSGRRSLVMLRCHHFVMIRNSNSMRSLFLL